MERRGILKGLVLAGLGAGTGGVVVAAEKPKAPPTQVVKLGERADLVYYTGELTAAGLLGVVHEYQLRHPGREIRFIRVSLGPATMSRWVQAFSGHNYRKGAPRVVADDREERALATVNAMQASAMGRSTPTAHRPGVRVTLNPIFDLPAGWLLLA